MYNFKKKLLGWLITLRIKTLILSISGVFMSAILAIKNHYFSIKIFIFSLITSILYQIISNIANDLGDGIKGIDNENSIGPKRAFQNQILTKQALIIGIINIVFCTLISTTYLLYISFIPKYWNYFFLFTFLGFSGILAALLYSLGKKPYSYLALGDLFVFIFFGLIQICGNYFLYSKIWDWWIILPAATIGCFCTAVLNLNNMRDIENDKKLGKHTLAVYLGLEYSKLYEILLLIIPFLLTIIYILKTCITIHYKNFLFLILFYISSSISKKIFYVINPINFNQHFNQIILLTFMFVILFGIGLLM